MSRAKELLFKANMLVGHALPASLREEIEEELRPTDPPFMNTKLTGNKFDLLRVEHGFMRDGDLTEFSKIVVAECIQCIDKEANVRGLQLTPSSEMISMGMIAAIGSIKRRFGINE